MLYPEKDILKPRDPSLTDEEQWPDFDLVEVTAEDSANVLIATESAPVVVRGRLQLERHQTQHLIRKNRGNGVTIEIPVSYIAYGELEDGGGVGIWIAGLAGWYFLKTAAAEYEETFARMIEAIELNYFLVDQYSAIKGKPRAKSKDKLPSVEQSFKAYAKQHKTCRNASQAANLFDSHRETLISFMLQKKEDDINWALTPFDAYLKSKFADDFDEIRARVEGKASRRSSTKTSTSKPPSRKSPDDGLPKRIKKDDHYFRAQVVWRLMGEYDDTLPDQDLAAVAEQMIHDYDIDDVRKAKDYILAHASVLIWLMARYRSPVDWTTSPLYTTLQKSNLPQHRINRVSQMRIRKRREHTPESPDDSELSEEENARLESEDELIKRRGNSGKGKKVLRTTSVLRPKSSKFSAKGKPPAQATNGDSVDAEYNNTPSKRKAESGDNENGTGKRPRSSNSVLASLATEVPTDEGIDVDSGPDSEAENIPALPFRLANSDTPNEDLWTVRGVTVHDFDGPNEPGDVWKCPRVGCPHRVYAASEEEGQELIARHREEHEPGGILHELESDDEKDQMTELVKREGGFSGVAVDQLMKKIRQQQRSQGHALEAAPDLVSMMGGARRLGSYSTAAR